MKNRFKVYEVFNGYMLEDLVTGRSVGLGDGVSTMSLEPLGTEEFRRNWEDELNECPDTMEAYFYNLYKLVIFDSPCFMDRYTVIVKPASSLEKVFANCKNLCECLSLSINPDSPQGFSQWGNCDPDYMDETQERIWFLDVPENIQAHIAKRLDE